MRRVDAEGDSRGVRVRDQAEGGSRSRLRRAAIEWLERRELLSTSTSTLPSPTVLSAPNLNTPPGAQVQDVSLATAVQALTTPGLTQASTPSVAADPLNPLRLVATWVEQSPTGFSEPGFNVPITSYIEGAYSINGGKSWNAITSAAFGAGGNLFGGNAGGNYSVNVQLDASMTPSPGTVDVLAQTTDPTIGYDRSSNFYILSSTHNATNSVGVLDLQRFNWAENAGAPTYNGLTPVYSWDTPDSGSSADPALTPVLAVDSNLPTSTDPATGKTVTDAFSGDMYAVWAEVDQDTVAGAIPGFNPDTIRMAASSDQGQHFTHAAYVDNSSNANGYETSVGGNPPPPAIPHASNARYSEPSVTISQGNGTTVPGGQVTIVYDDSNTIAPLDRILDQNVQDGGSSQQFAFVNPNGANPAGVIPNNNSTAGVSIPINVSLPANFTLQALDVTLKVEYPDVANFGATLVPPSGSGLASIRLFNGDIGVAPSGSPDGTANLGMTSGSNFGTLSGTVFDPEAVRPITDGSAASHAVGHYQPDGEFALERLQGKTAAQLNGTWTLVINIDTADSSTTDSDFVAGVNLNFTQGNDPGGDGTPEALIAGLNSLFIVPTENINPTTTSSEPGAIVHTANTASPYYDGISGTNVSGRGNTTAPTQGAIPILPAPAIASDNTLGSFSPYEGRIYVTFTGMFTGAQAGNTDVFLSYSNDGGKTWSNPTQVNDDDAALDGFSGALPGGPLGRAQYQSQVEVDQSTGDVVVSFLDARNDPSNARVATYVGVSSDGAALGPNATSGFTAEVYANPTLTALDAITGGAANLGPIPDNESTAGGEESLDGYGTRQALVVTNGRIVPFWTSNENIATNTAIVDSILSLAAGPRVIASTQGPVGVGTGLNAVNTTRAADGTTLANTIEVTFDRPIDPTSYAALQANVSVFYESPSGGAQVSLPIVSVTPLNGGGNTGATQFAIVFNPAGLPSFVGTYSYQIAPTGIVDQIRQGVSGARGTVMDQNADGTPGELPSAALPLGDDFVVGQPSAFAAYTAGTLPLIVPGPHLVSSVAVNPTTNAVIGSGGNDLVLNNNVGALELTFDRNIQVGSLTPAQVLGLFGPAGTASLAGLTITPLTVFTTGGQVAYAGGAVADVFKLTFANQQVSGTYTATLGTGIRAADGSGVDANLNAGLDALKKTATNGVTTPVSYASTAVPAAIQPATSNANGTTTPSVLMTPIVVPDDFPIQGDTSSVSTITLSLNITYPNDPDLTAYLLAPDGVTKVNLFSGIGAGTNTANFSNTTFSDVASTSIDKAGPPYFGTFLPEQGFGNFGPAPGGAGLNSQGTWTLVIENAGSSAGTLSSYSLTFQKPVSSTGLAEFPDDQTTASFQVFNLAANNPLANSTWTAVGPAGVTTSGNGAGTLAGTVASVAVDPSDKTGNTVYVGTASGGIWKTTDFLTTNPAGPTYVPLTDFGPNFAQDIGSLAVFGVNGDPAQSIIFAGTGFGQERTYNTAGNPNTDLNSGEGDGILRSTDGGKTWQVVLGLPGTSAYKIVVDPSPNVNGQPIVYAAMGGYDAANSTAGGLYRSLDGGTTWTKLAAGNATDVLLDPNSKSPTTGDLDTLYVAFSNIGNYPVQGYYPVPAGVYVSSNQGQTLQPYTGELGKDPLLVTPGFPAQPLAVQNSTTVSPNNVNSAYIVLAKPALTGNTAENLAYEGFLYAAVENYDGTFQGLYVTKDAGENWTLVQLGNIPGTGSVKAAIPTNATVNTDSYDPTSSNFSKQGAYNLTLTVDPTNPNIVYIGGSEDFQGSGLIRVNLTDLYDAHNLTSGSNEQSDGGLLFTAGQGGVNSGGAIAQYPVGTPTQILNLRYAPNNGTPGTSPFNINATLVIANAAGGFINNGTGVTWSAFDEPLKANAGDATGSTGLHDAIDYVDPITGDVRILFADNEGVFTALVNPDGTLNNGTGSDVEPDYSRNGNLQDEQVLTSAAEPSAKAAAQAGAEFFASGQTLIAGQSDANVLTDGNLTWNDGAVLSPSPTSPRNTTANRSINSSDRSGVGIATDQTGGVTSSNPQGSPTLYEFDVPILGGNLTDFFRVNQFGQTTGLDDNINQEFPAQGYQGDAHQGGTIVNPVTNVAPNIVGALTDGQVPEGDFEVNPLNGEQILISSATGNLYETTNGGILWTRIGTAADFGADDAIDQAPSIDMGKFVGKPGRVNPITTQVATVAYGAPDPNVSGGVGNLNNFIYIGTTGISYTPVDPSTDPTDPYIDSNDGNLYNDAKIYVTQAGGQGWTDVSSGLDGSSVVGIYPDPDRGSHAAYAVTKTGIFFSADTVGLAQAGKTVWTNITSNLGSLDYDAFGNPAYQQSVLAAFDPEHENLTIPPTPSGTPNLAPPTPYNPIFDSAYGGFTDIVADYRYQIPETDAAGTTSFFPVLYASGYGGVFRSIDNGATWTVFPNQSFDASPVDGGYLPNVDVTNLQLVLGDIDPDTGHPVQAVGDPEVLLASTFGRGDFAIRLAPDTLPTSIHLDPNLPAPGGSDSGDSNTDLITNVLQPYIDGISEVSNFGDVVRINLFDESPGPGFGTLLGTGTTNALGQFTVQVVDTGQDPTFFASSKAVGDKVVGIQAIDSSGASGNLTLLKYTLDLITPVTPDTPSLEAAYDTGRSPSDGLTDLSVPPQAGPGAPLTVATPVFDVTTNLPQANPLTPDPITLTVELLRGTSPQGPFFLIGSTQTGVINQAGTAETYMLSDPGLATLAAPGIDETFYYEALQVDSAGNVSTPASNLLTVVVNTIAPPAPTSITLDPSTNSGTSTPPFETSYTNPVFDVGGVLPGDQVFLYRSVDGMAPVLASVDASGNPNGPINNGTTAATLQVTDSLGATTDGVYTYYAVQQDIFGNYSVLGTGLVVTVNTQAAPATPVLEPAYDTGRSHSDDRTDIAVPPPTPGSTPTFVVPVFDVTTATQPAGQPPVQTVQLFRSTSPSGPFTLVGSSTFSGTNPATIGDGGLQAIANTGPVDQTYYYEANEINAAGIASPMSKALAVVVDTITPPTLPAATLDPASNTGLIKSQLITNIIKPTFDATNLLPGNQLFLYRSGGGKAPVLVGTGPVNGTAAAISATVTDAAGAVPDGLYQYYVVQQDLYGNISNFSMPVSVTINTSVPVAPTIALEPYDDSGLPLHPNVTNVQTPHLFGTAQYNSGTNFPVAIINVATGAVLGTTFPAANGTYLAQIASPLADGVYTLEARTTNLAGTFSFSSPLTITIKHTGPQIVPSLILFPADDTGVKGDDVTSNHDPRFSGVTDPGDTVSLYALVNGQLLGPEATTTSSTINGSFVFALPFNLTDGTTQLVAQTSDVANNKGVLSSPLTVRIATTTGDYLGTGKAQLTVFDPFNETYYIRGVGALTVDTTPGRDLPIQYDLNGDGQTDLTAYRFNTAEYFGYVSNRTGIDFAFGAAGSSLPVSGYFGASGTFSYSSYQAATGTWVIALPQPGGLVVNLGLPRVDVPVPAAYDGLGSTEIAVFRGSNFFGNDADSFDVFGPKGLYAVSFTNPAVAKLGFVYQPGDIPAPADYDGVGRDEFAVYRPSTGQFFILNTPNTANPATWTLRTVTLNLPGGPNAKDVPVSEDYDGDGKADPTVYRPSNSTFYIFQTSTNSQLNIPFGPAGQSVAAAGPLLYRLTALFGAYASTGGYASTSSGGPGGGLGSLGGIPANAGGSGGGGVHAESIASAANSTAAAPPPAGSPLSTMVALSMPLPVATAPAPTVAPAASSAPTSPVTIGVATPKAAAAILSGPKASTEAAGHAARASKAAKPLVVDSRSHEAQAKAATAAKAHAAAAAKAHAPAHAKAHAAAPAKSHAKAAALAATSLQHLVMARKGGKKS